MKPEASETPEIDTHLLQHLLKKHTPSNIYLLLHCVFSMIVCIGLGLFYAEYYLTIPDGVPLDQEDNFRFSLGAGYGLMLTILPWLVLIGRYIYLLAQVKTRAKNEYIALMHKD